MSRVPLGMLLGLVIGAVDVLLMLPSSFPDRRASFAGAFCARFALEDLIDLPLNNANATVSITTLIAASSAGKPRVLPLAIENMPPVRVAAARK